MKLRLFRGVRNWGQNECRISYTCPRITHKAHVFWGQNHENLVHPGKELRPPRVILFLVHFQLEETLFPNLFRPFFCFKLRCLWTSHKFLKVLHTIFSAGRLRAVLTANLGTLSFISWRCCMGFLPQTSPQIAKTRRHIFSYLYSTLKAWRKGALTVLDFKTKKKYWPVCVPTRDSVGLEER